MSEPMTSGEIEDVLSSIRKLVTEDLRPQPRVPAPVAPALSAPEAGKLILTPALRVVEGSAEAEAEATIAAMPEAAMPEEEPTRRLRLDTVVSSFAAQVSPPAEGWEAETGDATVTRLVRPVPPAAEADPFPDLAAADDAGTDPDPASGLHFAWASRRAEREADMPEEDLLSGPEDAPEAPMLDLDSDMLADLVRDILRDELQGALGERMTRNIRKLVRAEVARMLATRDLA